MYGDKVNQTQPGSERESQVGAQLARQNIILDELEKNIHILGDRISTVLSNDGTGLLKDKPTASENPSVVPLASSIRERNDRLQTLTDIIYNYSRRVEL